MIDITPTAVIFSSKPSIAVDTQRLIAVEYTASLLLGHWHDCTLEQQCFIRGQSIQKVFVLDAAIFSSKPSASNEH